MTIAKSFNMPSAPIPWAARKLLEVMENMKGRIELITPNGEHIVLGHEGDPAHLHIKNWRVFREVMLRSDIGFAQTYIDGDWHSNNLAYLLTVLASNRESLSGVWRRSSLSKWLHKCKHWLNANTRRGSKRNIAAHYDLGNEFFSLWLDESLSYSSALFTDRCNQSLESAQWAKYERILSELEATPSQRILEIGCGFGAFAELASKNHLQVHGITLSEKQYQIATARVSPDKAQFEIRDYRDVNDQYDHVVSIEMFEAVGYEYWPTYFEKIKRVLAADGKAVIQTITIADELFEDYRKDTDFIQQFIFPGGLLPSIKVFKERASSAGLKIINQHAFGLDYAETLRRWNETFSREKVSISALGFDHNFMRTWEFYLAYCEAGFEAGSTDVVQFTLAHA